MQPQPATHVCSSKHFVVNHLAVDRRKIRGIRYINMCSVGTQFASNTMSISVDFPMGKPLNSRRKTAGITTPLAVRDCSLPTCFSDLVLEVGSITPSQPVFCIALVGRCTEPP